MIIKMFIQNNINSFTWLEINIAIFKIFHKFAICLSFIIYVIPFSMDFIKNSIRCLLYFFGQLVMALITPLNTFFYIVKRKKCNCPIKKIDHCRKERDQRIVVDGFDNFLFVRRKWKSRCKLVLEMELFCILLWK